MSSARLEAMGTGAGDPGDPEREDAATVAEMVYVAGQRLLLHRLELLMVDSQETFARMLRGASLSFCGAFLAAVGWAALVAGILLWNAQASAWRGLLIAGGVHVILGVALVGAGYSSSLRSARRRAELEAQDHE